MHVCAHRMSRTVSDLSSTWPLFALVVRGFRVGRAGTLQATAHSCTDCTLLEQVSR